MLRWMLRVDNWLDVAPLKNMEEDHSFLFLKKNLMKIFFFFWKTWIFQRNWKLWNFFLFLFLSFSFFFFFLKNLEILNFFKELKILIDFFFFFFEIWRFVHYQKVKKWRWRCRWSDKDLFMMIFFFFWKNLSFEWE